MIILYLHHFSKLYNPQNRFSVRVVLHFHPSGKGDGAYDQGYVTTPTEPGDYDLHSSLMFENMFAGGEHLSSSYSMVGINSLKVFKFYNFSKNRIYEVKYENFFKIGIVILFSKCIY
jgi:hypothetical protein